MGRSTFVTASLLACIDCSGASEEPRYEAAYDLAEAVCDRWGMECVAVEDLSPFAWARYTAYRCGEGTVRWDLNQCATDLELCEAALMHEVGHKELCTNDEYAADAWVIEHGTEVQIDSLVYLLCVYYGDDAAYRCVAARDLIRQEV